MMFLTMTTNALRATQKEKARQAIAAFQAFNILRTKKLNKKSTQKLFERQATKGANKSFPKNFLSSKSKLGQDAFSQKQSFLSNKNAAQEGVYSQATLKNQRLKESSQNLFARFLAQTLIKNKAIKIFLSFIIVVTLLFIAPPPAHTQEAADNTQTQAPTDGDATQGDKDEVHEGGDEDEEEKDEVQGGGKYQTNAAGDQFIRIALMPNFPINFDDKLYVGAAAQIGYYRFLTWWLGLGAELMVGYNPTKGSNSLAFIPLTVGVIFQPYIWRFEFPFTVSVGLAFETCENKKYFPGFASKTEFDVYYRINDSWSVGLGYEAWYLPQWNPTTKGADNDYGIFMSVLVAARYHF